MVTLKYKIIREIIQRIPYVWAAANNLLYLFYLIIKKSEKVSSNFEAN